MEEIQLRRAFGKKFAILGAFGFLIFLAILGTVNDQISGMPIQGIWAAFVILVLIGFFCFITLLIFRHSIVRITEQGIWQWQILSTVFISWNEVQKVEIHPGIRTVISTGKMIIIQLEDFKDPDKLMLEIEKRVPKSVF